VATLTTFDSIDAAMVDAEIAGASTKLLWEPRALIGRCGLNLILFVTSRGEVYSRLCRLATKWRSILECRDAKALSGIPRVPPDLAVDEFNAGRAALRNTS